MSTNKKISLSISKEGFFVSNKALRRPGGGRPQKYKDLEDFIVLTVRRCWESGASISPEQLHCMILRHAYDENIKGDYDELVQGKRSTLNRYVQRVLARNQFSVRKISISQSVPADWRSKAEENSARIRSTFFEGKG